MKSLLKNSIARKMIMSITGMMMVFFVIMHLIGNLTILFGGINAYAYYIHSLPFILWIIRTFILMVFVVHMVFGIVLHLGNIASRPGPYTVKKRSGSGFAGRNMIWTGLLTGVFIVYHLLHFSLLSVNPHVEAKTLSDALGRPDILTMIVRSFSGANVFMVYAAAVTVFALHLTHGIQSSFQTMGMANEKTLPLIIKAGRVAAFILAAGFISVPVFIITGIMDG